MTTSATTVLFDQVTLINIIKAFVFVVGGFIVAKLSMLILERFVEKKIQIQYSSLIKRILFYLILVIFLLSALEQLGFKISILLGAAGIFTVAIGFASQTSFSNFISGLFLIIEKPFAIGDVLTVSGITGTVISIDTLSVKLRTADNLFVRIPSENIIKTNIINLSKYPVRRYDLSLGISYKENISHVRELLLQVAANNRLCLQEPMPQLQFINFGDFAINFQFSVWGEQNTFSLLKSSLAEEVKECFEKNNIEMPFPIQTIGINQPLLVKITHQ